MKCSLGISDILEEISSISHSVVFLYFFAWIIEKAREFQKNIYFCFTDYAKAFVWITINCGKFWKRWEYQTIWPVSWETYMQVRKPQLELDMEQQTGSKSGKE